MEHKTCKIVVFEQDGSGELKIAGIESFGRNIEIVDIFNVTGVLPELIDEPEEYLPEDFAGDLVLNFLRHPDLSEYLVKICRKKKIPVVASGQRIPGAICPFTCCGLGKKEGLGAYGSQFGLPEYELVMEHGTIIQLQVKRGASCGATWQVVQKLLGLDADKALEVVGREVQYLCMADPSAFDPVSGKSAVHYAGDVHAAALKRAIKQSRRCR